MRSTGGFAEPRRRTTAADPLSSPPRHDAPRPPGTDGPPALATRRLGDGPPVCLVHGSVLGPELTWRKQEALARRWTILLPARRGFPRSPPTERVDFAVDAVDVAALLDEPTHLVGHSYGGVVTLLAAARRPALVRSLTVIEPPAFALARDVPAVDTLATAIEDLWRDGPEDAAAFLSRFFALMGVPTGSRDRDRPLRGALARGADLLRDERLPHEARVPLGALAAAPFPKLVVSGGHHPALEAICDVLAAGIGAQRATVEGGGHSVPQTGEPLTRVLETFIEQASGPPRTTPGPSGGRGRT